MSETAILIQQPETGAVATLCDAEVEWVSVIVPCFNGAAFIARTIESVLAQTHSQFELIVVDDCSTDDSAKIVSDYSQRDPRVSLLSMPRNAGAPAAPRNAGVRAARAPWVAFLDADDIWHPRKIELQLQALRDHGGDMCSTRMIDFRDESKLVFTPPTALCVERVTLGMQLRKYRTPTSSVVVKREFMLAHPFKDDQSCRDREDTDCFIRAHEYMPYSLKITHPLVSYRLHSGQVSGDKLIMVKRHLNMLRNYRLKSGHDLGVMAYVYAATHFLSSIWLRLVRHTL